jgi:hypothetical protein
MKFASDLRMVFVNVELPGLINQPSGASQALLGNIDWSYPFLIGWGNTGERLKERQPLVMNQRILLPKIALICRFVKKGGHLQASVRGIMTSRSLP